MQKLQELQLVRRAARGDLSAAEMLIRRHQAGVQAYIYRMCGRWDVAEDVTQEAFLRVLSSLHNFNENFRFSTWLFTIARRVWLNICEKKRPASAGDASDIWAARRDDHVGTIGRDAEQRGMAKDAIQSALLLLSTEQREAIVLFHQLDWPIKLISEHMELPEGTVKSHLHRGRQRLRSELVRGVGDVVAIEEPAGSLPLFARRAVALSPGDAQP
ncbi:MAG: RNA polymerase sigma factor [Phycisphaerae bacterium]|nr:RNA polymerase sigma factor [Phycisphaerae bacterium]MBN8598175.1 RNA polymerase sigma factor [Planctomycetota bacterium]